MHCGCAWKLRGQENLSSRFIAAILEMTGIPPVRAPLTFPETSFGPSGIVLGVASTRLGPDGRISGSPEPCSGSPERSSAFPERLSGSWGPGSGFEGRRFPSAEARSPAQDSSGPTHQKQDRAEHLMNSGRRMNFSPLHVPS